MPLSPEEWRRVTSEEAARIEEREYQARKRGVLPEWEVARNEERANRTPDQRMGTILGWTALGVLLGIFNIGKQIADLDWNTFWGQFGQMLGVSGFVIALFLIIGLFKAN